jgi:hypothetical protein
MWWCVPVIPLTTGSPNKNIKAQASQDQMQELISQVTTAKRVRGMAQEVEHLPRWHEALISNPSVAK